MNQIIITYDTDTKLNSIEKMCLETRLIDLLTNEFMLENVIVKQD